LGERLIIMLVECAAMKVNEKFGSFSALVIFFKYNVSLRMGSGSYASNLAKK